VPHSTPVVSIEHLLRELYEDAQQLKDYLASKETNATDTVGSAFFGKSATGGGAAGPAGGGGRGGGGGARAKPAGDEDMALPTGADAISDDALKPGSRAATAELTAAATVAARALAATVQRDGTDREDGEKSTLIEVTADMVRPLRARCAMHSVASLLKFRGRMASKSGRPWFLGACSCVSQWTTPSIRPMAMRTRAAPLCTR
jgi:hypothetical protein